jgi:hypothetical protein
VAQFINVDGLFIDNMAAPTVEGVTPAVFSPDVRNVTVINSPTITGSR